MNLNKISSAIKAKRYATGGLVLFGALSALTTGTTLAQEQATEDIEVIQVSGIRASLTNALAEKQSAPNLKEVIQAVDIGKMPDQNLAEVLENITGVQITRTAGIGTGVQIRGTNSNRVEINGVSTTGAGGGRNGISFEDVNASIISAVEVTKAPDAKTIEGSVGGTVNLRTIRPLELNDTLASIRVQGEDSSLSVESIKPRFSGAYGDKWQTDVGEIGFVISGSYTEQEAVSFRPRADRDNLSTNANGGSPAEFQGIQFFVQEQENDDYETINLATTLEWQPNDNTKVYFDAIINEQERSRDSYRVQASGVSAFRNLNVPTVFETINYGMFGGQDLGTKEAAYIGQIGLDTPTSENPNLRFSSDTGARITDTAVFVLGGEWQGENLKVKAEIATSKSDTTNPNLSTTLNFINPNCDIEGNTRNENCTPFRYDFTGKTLAWGINFDSSWAPAVADLTNPANVVLDQVDVGRNETENQEDAFRLDFNYFLDNIKYITSVDFGYRFNKSSHRFDDIDDRIGGFSQMKDSPNGTLFQELLVTGPDNFGDGDGRSLFVKDFLLIDPDRAFNDQQGVIDILQAAVVAHDPDSPDILNVQPDQNAFRNIEEETSALYVQANFEYGDRVSGNIGLRYVETTVDSIGYGPEDANGNRALQTTTGDYDFILPRLNLVVEAADDVLVRFGYGSDIRRPDFTQLSTGFAFTQAENTAVALGNPGLEPEEVDSIDLSVEYYFAPAAVASVGYFRKERTNIFGIDFDGAVLNNDPLNDTGGLSREPGPNCPGGGIYNPIVIPGVLGVGGIDDQIGMCVDVTRPGNDPETTTQTGWEFAFQYGLDDFEDELGWASGFGMIANFTIQDFSGGSIEDSTSGRGLQVLGEVSAERGLLDFSETAYNFTLYYEKYGLSARMRYTWREAFRTQDFAGGANTSGSSTLSFPVYTADRGQLNASVNYNVNDQLNVGVEAVNLTEEGIEQYCVNDGALLCFVGIPDRRVTFGATYKF